MLLTVIGGDHLGSIRKKLANSGHRLENHISGRNPNHQNRIHLPQTTSLVIVLIDYINHNTAMEVKRQAKNQGIPVLFAKRSWSSIVEKAAQAGIALRA